MDGKKYEYKVAGYLRRRGFRKVRVTKASNDYGVDVIAYKRRQKYAVQCKFYSKPVGVHAVQQVVGGMRYYDCDRAIVVTNNTFTRQAVELAQKNEVILIDRYSGRTGIRKLYLTIILLLILANLLLTDWWPIGVIGIAVYLFVTGFGIYVRTKYKYRNTSDIEADSEEIEQ